MIVLSDFDGMACGRLALERIGITPSIYFATENDKWAMLIAKKNFPDICHLGDIEQTHGLNLPRPWLLMGGSPCQGLSIAGKRLGLKDPRSRLFYEFVKHKEEYSPEFFLMENVLIHNKSDLDEISRLLGVEPIRIDSKLVSAQQRKRLYWTNIPGITQPADKGILLRDIIETAGTGVIKNHGELQERESKSMCLDANYYKGIDNHGQRTFIYMTVEQIKKARERHSYKMWPSGNHSGSAPFPTDLNGKSKTVTTRQRATNRTTNHIDDGSGIRMLTPIEFERLQTLPDNYTEGVSNTQRYKMIGNGWTIDVIAHILSFMPLPKTNSIYEAQGQCY